MSKSHSASYALALTFALSLTSISVAQGPPGGGRGGPGGRGGFGGGGSSLLTLVQAEPVQEELKLTDPQKIKLKELSDVVGKKRTDLFAQMRGNRGGQANPGAATAAVPNAGRVNVDPNAAAPANPAAGTRGRGNRGNPAAAGAQNAPADAAGGAAPAQNGGRGGPGGPGGPGGFGNMTDEQQLAFQAQMDEMRANGDKLTKDAEAALAKILDAKQKTRLSQIQLQRQGVGAFQTPELIAKLNINEDTQAQIKEVLDGQGQARRAQFTKMRETMAQLVGGGNGGQVDRQAMRDAMQNPENQAKMDVQRKVMDEENKTLESTTKIQIGKFLSKKQKDLYAKLVGTPFDLTKLNGPGGPGGPGGRRGPGGPNGAAPATPGATADTPAVGAQPGTTNPAAPAKKSLRDRRGTSDGTN